MLLVDLVYKYFISYSRFDLVSSYDQVPEHLTCILVVLGLSIYHINQSSTVLHQGMLIRLERVVTWEVHHAKLYVGVVVHILLLHLGCGQQEEGLVRRHLLEHNLLDTGFARPIERVRDH